MEDMSCKLSESSACRQTAPYSEPAGYYLIQHDSKVHGGPKTCQKVHESCHDSISGKSSENSSKSTTSSRLVRAWERTSFDNRSFLMG